MGQIKFTLDQTLQKINLSGYMLSKLSNVRTDTIYDMQRGDTQRVHIDALQSILDALNAYDTTRDYTIEDVIQYQK